MVVLSAQIFNVYIIIYNSSRFGCILWLVTFWQSFEKMCSLGCLGHSIDSKNLHFVWFFYLGYEACGAILNTSGKLPRWNMFITLYVLCTTKICVFCTIKIYIFVIVCLPSQLQIIKHLLQRWQTSVLELFAASKNSEAEGTRN